MENARLFIRNDDVWELNSSFRFFFDQLFNRSLPVVYAVIPGKMENELVRFLCQAKEKNPHLLDIVQHGWMHANYAADTLDKFEFGERRSLEDQRQDIRQGLKKMKEAFGDYFTPAFVPPFHGYDERTLQILREEGFWGFSAGRGRRGQAFGLAEFSAEISFSRYENDRIELNNVFDMVEMLVRGVSGRPLAGIVTHHADFTNKGARREMTRFFDLIETLQSRKEIRTVLFSELYKDGC